jgi:hypothetical protein
VELPALAGLLAVDADDLVREVLVAVDLRRLDAEAGLQVVALVPREKLATVLLVTAVEELALQPDREIELAVVGDEVRVLELGEIGGVRLRLARLRLMRRAASVALALVVVRGHRELGAGRAKVKWQPEPVLEAMCIHRSAWVEIWTACA